MMFLMVEGTFSQQVSAFFAWIRSSFDVFPDGILRIVTFAFGLLVLLYVFSLFGGGGSKNE